MSTDVQMLNKILNGIEELTSIQGSWKVPEWMTIAEAAKYANVSINTFAKFRIMGLKISQIDGVKRVSKKEVDRFLEENSY